MSKVYTYPNGLRCAASEKRIKAFELIVPVILAGLCIAGIVIIPVEFFDKQNVAGSILLSLLLLIGWAVAIFLLFAGIFKVWCKPLPMNDHQ